MSSSRSRHLGALERAVLDHLWATGSSDVKAAHASVGASRGITPNTVHSALERLCRKGLVLREKRGRAWSYRAGLTRREWLAEAIEELITGLPGTRADAVLSAFVDVAERTDGAELEELERRVRARRGEG